MKTDRTAGITGIAGTPLSHQAIESGNQTTGQPSLKTKPTTAISDTVETSDRDANGRLNDGSHDSSPNHKQPSGCPDPQQGDRLDLTA